MNRQEFKTASSELRAIITFIERGNAPGRFYTPSRRWGVSTEHTAGNDRYIVINRIADNVVATLEPTVLVRYRPNSYWAYVFKNLDRKKWGAVVPSNTLREQRYLVSVFAHSPSHMFDPLTLYNPNESTPEPSRPFQTRSAVEYYAQYYDLNPFRSE